MTDMENKSFKPEDAIKWVKCGDFNYICMVDIKSKLFKLEDPQMQFIQQYIVNNGKFITIETDNYLLIEYRNEKGQLHNPNENCPAWIKIFTNGRRELKDYINDELHNENKPSHWVYQTGKATENYWYKNNVLHRDGGAAVKKKWSGYKLKIWYKEGKMHRVDGAAYTENVLGESTIIWYFEGKMHPVGGPV
jgi:hypothetical protein